MTTFSIYQRVLDRPSWQWPMTSRVARSICRRPRLDLAPSHASTSLLG